MQGYNEKLLEFSPVYGESLFANTCHKVVEVEWIGSKSTVLSHLQESNFYQIMVRSQFKKFLENSAKLGSTEKYKITEDLINVLKELQIIFPTIFKIQEKLTEALEVCQNGKLILTMLHKITEYKQKYSKFEAQLSLISSSLIVEECEQQKEKKNKEGWRFASKKLETEIGNLDELHKDLDEQDAEMLYYEKIFLQAYQIYLNWQFLSDRLKREQFKEAITLIDNARIQFNQDPGLKQRMSKYYTKLILLKGLIKNNENIWSKQNSNYSIYEKIYLKEFDACFESVETWPSKQLQYIAFKLKTEFLLSREINEANLVLAKNFYAEKTIQLTKELKNYKKEMKCKKLISSIEENLQKFQSRKLIFLHSWPLYLPKQQQSQPAPIPLSPFKINNQLTLKFLRKSSKLLTLIEKILTLENLKEALQTGCKYTNENTLLFEGGGPLWQPVLVTKDQLLELKSQETVFNFVNLLILALPKGRKYYELFQQLNCFENIVFFDFSDEINENVLMFAIDQFMLTFYQELLDGESINNSFHYAKERMLQQVLSFQEFSEKEVSEIQSSLGSGPQFMSLHCALIHKFSQASIDAYTPFQSGKVTDLSQDVNIKTNLPERPLYFIGHSKAFERVQTQITEGWSMNIYGENGVGKTQFMITVGRFFARRGFFPDGVWYFDLGKEKHKSTLIQIMKKALGKDFAKNTTDYFKSKKMLIIYDDADQQEIQYYKYVLSLLKQNKIQHVIITKELKNNQELADAYLPQQIKTLTKKRRIQLIEHELNKQLKYKKVALSEILENYQSLIESEMTPSELVQKLKTNLVKSPQLVSNQPPKQNQQSKGKFQGPVPKFFNQIPNSLALLKVFKYKSTVELLQSQQQPRGRQTIKNKGKLKHQNKTHHDDNIISKLIVNDSDMELVDHYSYGNRAHSCAQKSSSQTYSSSSVKEESIPDEDQDQERESQQHSETSSQPKNSVQNTPKLHLKKKKKSKTRPCYNFSQEQYQNITYASESEQCSDYESKKKDSQ